MKLLAALLVVAAAAFWTGRLTVSPRRIILQTWDHNENPPIITSTSPLPTATIGSAYSMQFSVSGGNPPYVWQLVDGALPPGFVMHSYGLVESQGGMGVLDPQIGDHWFVVSVTDSSKMPYVTEKAFDLKVSR